MMAGRDRGFILGIVAGIVGLASGAKAVDKVALRADHSGSGVLTSDAKSTIVLDSALAPSPEQSVIICNAYAHNQPLDIINLNSHARLTQGAGLSYKSCEQFRAVLKEGDRLEFKAGNASVGIFRATGIPKSRASLLLIPHRREANTLSAAFKSHAFIESGGSQIAVVDAYRGQEAGKVKIMDAEPVVDKASQETLKPPRVEELHYNSVVALSAGKYQVMLQGDNDRDISKMPLLVATEQGNHVVMRTGLQGRNTTSAYPQALVVFSETKMSRSSAATLKLSMLAVALSGIVALLA